MKNKEIRSLAKDRMKGKMGKAIIISLIYFAIIFVGTFILNIIPIIGSLAASILATPLAFGWMKQLMDLENGQNVGWVDFISHGFANFGKVWCSNLWIALKAIGFIFLILVGTFLTTVNGVLGFVVTLASIIGMIIVMYRYSMINYTIAYDNSNMRARDLVKKSAADAKGKIWKYLCMGFYYGLLIFSIYFLGALITGVIIRFVPILGLVLMPIYFIGLIVAVLYFSMQSIAACNEYYKINVLGMSDGNSNNIGYNPIQNMNQNNYGYDSNQNNYGFETNQNNYGYDQNQNNYGSAIDMNNSGQSNDFFNNQQ